MDATLAAPRFRHVVFVAPNRAPRRAGSSAAPIDRAAHEPIAIARDEEAFLRSLFFQANLHFRSYRIETLRRRIPACLRALHCTSLDEARRFVRRDPQALTRALSALLIGVTGFFRDANVFDTLRRRHLPHLLDAAAGRPLRVWSVGCSDGSELYSIAVLLAERNALLGADLLGTDCRAAAIDAARAANYSSDAIGAVPPELRESSFQFDGRSWRVAAHLRALVRFEIADALRPPSPAGEWDLILCRNMSMYLRPDDAGRLWQRLQRTLRPGGLLVLGKAERPEGAQALRPLSPCIYQKDNHAAARFET